MLLVVAAPIQDTTSVRYLHVCADFPMLWWPLAKRASRNRPATRLLQWWSLLPQGQFAKERRRTRDEKLKAFLGVARRLFFTLSHFTRGSLFRHAFWTGKVDSRFGQSVKFRFVMLVRLDEASTQTKQNDRVVDERSTQAKKTDRVVDEGSTHKKRQIG